MIFLRSSLNPSKIRVTKSICRYIGGVPKVLGKAITRIIALWGT